MCSLLCKTCISFLRRLAVGCFMADEEQILSAHVIIMQAKWGNTFLCSTVQSYCFSFYYYKAFAYTTSQHLTLLPTAFKGNVFQIDIQLYYNILMQTCTVIKHK